VAARVGDIGISGGIDGNAGGVVHRKAACRTGIVQATYRRRRNLTRHGLNGVTLAV
jgi:hypothetical protein